MSANTKPPVVIVGAGYVGLITAVGLAEKREVRLVEKRVPLLRKLKSGEITISEPHLEQRFAENRDRLFFYDDLRKALGDGAPQLVFVAVGTPTRQSGDSTVETPGEANLEAVEKVIDVLLEQEGIAVVMKSTVPPGTGREVSERAAACGSDLEYLSCPEFLQEGRAFETFDEPDRIVVGAEATSWASEELRRLHAEFHPEIENDTSSTPYVEMSLTSAELVKYASNLQLAMRISYANEMGNIAEELGADISDVMAAVGEDARIGRDFLNAGVGFGGSCFGKDVRAIRAVGMRENVDMSLADAVLSINEGQIDRTLRKLERRLGDLRSKRIAILGLAFKPDTDDLRDGPAFALAQKLRERHATVSAWDPERGARLRATANYSTHAAPERMSPSEMADSALDAMAEADAVVLVTEWGSFKELDWAKAASAMRGNLVIDGRNCIHPAAVLSAGLEYEGTGRESAGLFQPVREKALKG